MTTCSPSLLRREPHLRSQHFHQRELMPCIEAGSHIIKNDEPRCGFALKCGAQEDRNGNRVTIPVCASSHARNRRQPSPKSEAFRARLLTLQQEGGSRTRRPASQLRSTSMSAGAPRPSRSPASASSATLPGHGQPPQRWPSASPPSLRDGPSPTSPPHSAAITSLATPASPARPPTSAVRFPRQFAGPPEIRAENPLRVLPSSSRSFYTLHPRSAC